MFDEELENNCEDRVWPYDSVVDSLASFVSKSQ